MLSRFHSKVLLRAFSGGHDPFWLHLHQEHDNYPQYAHLHWHTVDPLEVGKYAKQRSAAEFGDHVSEDPAPIEWFPEMGDFKTMDKFSRDEIFSVFLRHGAQYGEFLNDNEDHAYISHDDHSKEGHEVVAHKQNVRTLGDGVRDTVLSVMNPEQINKATNFAKNLIENYSKAGVPFTRESVREKTKVFMLKSLSKHQARELQEAMIEHLEDYGCGLAMGEEY